MSFFKKVRAYFHRRAAKKLNALAEGVHLLTLRSESHRGHFVYPGFDTFADIEVQGQHLGYVDYGISPLNDRLYINNLQIHPEHQRQGLGLATLWVLYRTYQKPIVPLHQYTSSYLFWTAARKRLAAAGAPVKPELHSFTAMYAEQTRWQHLLPETDTERWHRHHRSAAHQPVTPPQEPRNR